MAEDWALRTVGDDVRAWLDEINAHSDPNTLSGDVLSLPPTPDNCAFLLSKLAPSIAGLPFDVRRRCVGEDEDAFRSGCFLVLRRWHDRTLALWIEPMANDVGSTEEADGQLLVRVGVGTENPFGLSDTPQPRTS